jgi:DNA phosphorothioation-dependent restriction protein DptH
LTARMPRAACCLSPHFQPNTGVVVSKLAHALAEWIQDRMAGEILSLPSGSRECRAVFTGPPEAILEEVFNILAGDGRLLRVTTPDGQEIAYPVVLQTKDAPGEDSIATPTRSGRCGFHGLAMLRNLRNCGVYLTLVAPGSQASDTHDSTRKAFGLASQATEGGAPISAWWHDRFVQEMVDKGLGVGDATQLEQAKRLVNEAIVAADAADQHAVVRASAWEILRRLWELRDTIGNIDVRVSLAAGFPPSEDERPDANNKSSVLGTLAEKLESANLGTGIAQIKEHAKDDEERRHLDEFLAHARRKCEVVTALRRSMPHYYAPDEISPPPAWWTALTQQRWESLLEEDAVDLPKTGIEVACANPLALQVKGFVPVVRDVARVIVRMPEHAEGLQIRITREAPGGAASKREWLVACSGGVQVEVEDKSIPAHKTPIKYVVEVIGQDFKKASLKLISLATWEPGLIVVSRTATKGRPPKLTPNKPMETTLEMSGAGRHYLDMFARPGLRVISDFAVGNDEEGPIDSAKIGRVSDDEYGLEVEAGGERNYEFEIIRPGQEKKDKFKICLLADETAAEECGSYFEYHLARNTRRDGSKLPRAVHANGQARSAQLQGWMLDEGRVTRSYYPFVLAPDYASEWQRRDWSSAEDTIFSSARFLNDPRPAPDDMRPPEAFLQARTAITARIRGRDGNDLVESANLGEWLATDADFEAEVDAYVRSYLDWLSSSPTEAIWCDIGLVMELESDGATLEQVPNAVVVSPLHPIRLAWQCLAQRAMYLTARKLPCPAASIMDPDCVPDSIVLPLRDATGGVNEVVYFSVECSSDYWGILWNTNRLDRLAKLGAAAPLDREMGLLVGGISSGFSVSQVHRAMDDVCEMLVAKPVVGVLVSSAAGQNNACNDGILSWARKNFATNTDQNHDEYRVGASEVHIFDERGEDARPDDAEISNLAEDTANAVQWYSKSCSSAPHDLAIIAQLETSNAGARPTKLTSPLGVGGLVRARIREQQKAGSGQFLCESRVAGPARVFGEGVADNTAKAIATLEGRAATPMGYVFAPSINAVKKSLDKAEFAAVSSSAVDPACFLGNWLEGTYLWDYELPSYSSRSGDSNGYYLLSRIKELDLHTLKIVLQRLPGCDQLTSGELSAIVQEVARRGIPTVRGLSAGHSGATGDLGLFIATRLLQDSFRSSGNESGLLQPWVEYEGSHQVTLVIPVDPFQRYLDDLARAIKKPTMHRPDLIVVSIVASDSTVKCKVTPIEVKNRGGASQMSAAARLDALGQAKSLSSLLQALREAYTEDQEMLLWRLAYQNLLASMVGYGFRVYSQHLAEGGRVGIWSNLQSRVMEAILSSEVAVDVDDRGRLIVIDGSTASGSRDTDGDGFKETVEISQADASFVVQGKADALYRSMKGCLGNWQLLPTMPTDTDIRKPIADVLPPHSGDREPATTQPDIVAETPTTDPHVEHLSPSDVLTQAGNPGSQSVASPAVTTSFPAQPDHGSTQTGLILRIGESLDGFQSRARYLNLGHTALNQLNMGVVGDLGTGKTQLLKSLVYQISSGAAGNRGVTPNFLIFDYKKDYSAQDFLEATGARVVRPQHLPLNLFDLSGAAQSISPWLDRYRFFADAIDKIYPGIGPKQRDRLKNSIKDAYKDRSAGNYPTIYDVHRNYVDSLDGGADSLSGILGDLVDMELFASDPASIVGADEFLKGVVVISLNELGQDDRTKNMLVAIMLNVFYEHMLRIPKRPFLGPNGDMRVVDSMLLVDEADNIMKYEFDVLRKILLQGREFGVGVILASQYLSHFKVGATDYREPLLTWFLHKVPNLKAQELGALGLNDPSLLQQVAERIKALGLHECLYKTHDVPGEFIKGAPFYRRAEWK